VSEFAEGLAVICRVIDWDMRNNIALRRLGHWVNQPGAQDLFQTKALEFELGQLGFRIGNIAEFTTTTREKFAAALAVLAEMRGANVQYVPLFTQFPDDLPNDHEYLLRRIFGFLGLDSFSKADFGADPVTQMQREDLWDIAVEAQQQRLSDTQVEWLTLTLVSQAEADRQLVQWATDLLYGGTPIKEALWEDIFAVLSELNVAVTIEQVLIKETLARLAAKQWQGGGEIVVRTPTDLLRMFAFIQGQDVSLAQPIDLKGLKFSKPQRRAIVTFLNQCPALADDLLRYRNLWISLSKWLHPGDFGNRFPAVAKAFDDLRNDRIKSFESLVINASIADRLEKLRTRPSMLLRKLTWLLKDYPAEVLAEVLWSLEGDVANLPLALLVTVYCALQYDGDRVVINKQGKPHTVKRRTLVADPAMLLVALDALILSKLRGTKDWDTVWIDPAIDKLVLPLQARKQSDGLLNLARGSRIRVDTEVIRLFVYWHETSKRTDLDLSVVTLNADFQYAGHIGWNQYGDGKDIAHSGDIQSAPLGASEFIDLRLSGMASAYVLPSVLRYGGERFADLKTCYAGWMKRQRVGADMKTFDARTVSEKIAVNQAGRLWIPFLLDVAAQEIICMDLYAQGGNMVEENAHFPSLAKGLASYGQAKPTFGQLARWYVRANHANLVDRQVAKTTIGMSDDCHINVLRLVGQGVTSF
jgi:hypothetical protein